MMCVKVCMSQCTSSVWREIEINMIVHTHTHNAAVVPSCGGELHQTMQQEKLP